MALTELQRAICRLIAATRIAQGESYLAGGAALNALMGTPRVSRDLDLFHDTDEALAATWDADRKLLEASGYQVQVLRERPAFVEATVTRLGESVLLQWSRDSAYRFFPLVSHKDLGLTLHPLDLATNIAELSFEGPPPDAGELSRRWRRILLEAEEVIAVLPAREVGKCVLGRDGGLYAGSAAQARQALLRSEIVFHEGSIRGALPQIVQRGAGS